MTTKSEDSAPPRGPIVAGEKAADRLMRSLDTRLHPGTSAPSRAQAAIVLHALADHTALVEALCYRRPDSGFWPEATSVGRWLHDTADQLTSVAHNASERAL